MDSNEPEIIIYKTTEELFEILRSAQEDPQVDVNMLESPRKPGKTDILRDLMIARLRPALSQVEIDSFNAQWPLSK